MCKEPKVTFFVETMQKVRLHHFDMLKGIAIFMVVMGHVLTMCIRDIDSAVLFKFVEKMHMPIFFFISGYFTYKVTEQGRWIMPKLWARAKQLLVPFFVVSALWIYYFPHSGLGSPFTSTWEGLYMDAGKNGYWFTLCLFELMLVYCVMALVLSHCRTILRKIAAVVGGWAILYILTHYLLSDNINNVFGLLAVTDFYPIFMVGVLARSERTAFERITSSSTWITLALIAGGILMYYVCWPWEFTLPGECLDVARTLLYFCVVIVAVSVVKPWSERAFCENRPQGTLMARMWECVGTQSLAIYLLHYFLLFPMPAFREILIGMHLNLIPTLIVAAFFAAIIITVTLGVNYVIGHSRLLALLLTGKTK